MLKRDLICTRSVHSRSKLKKYRSKNHLSLVSVFRAFKSAGLCASLNHREREREVGVKYLEKNRIANNLEKPHKNM